MKRSGIARGTSTLKRSGGLARTGLAQRQVRLPAMSAHRKADRPLRDVVVDYVRKRDVSCRAGAFGYAHVCAGPLDVHEIIPRSAWAAGYLVPSNTILVCRKSHDWIGNHPVDAHALGLHGYSWERPRD